MTGQSNLTTGWIVTVIVALIAIFTLKACEDSRTQTVTWIEYEPVYMSAEEFRNSVGTETSKDLKRPGKIYFYEGYLLVNELNKGIHVIDNSNPENPIPVTFINIPASKDMAVRNGMLYADSHKDLLVFDFSNPENPHLLHRLEDIFSVTANMAPGFTTQQVNSEQGIVVDWEPKIREEVCEGDCHTHPAAGFPGFGFRTADAATFMSSESGGGTTGTGGSMARFTITGEHLYAVDHYDLFTFSLTSEKPVLEERKQVGWAIETIFPYRENLFIGSASAMYIYDLKSNPSSPTQLSVYWHANACDPVVVEGDFAFVTLRDGELCPRGVNRLEVIDVADLNHPEKVKFYEMINPHGLGINNGKLFVSEGKHGLKVMDASDPKNIRLLKHITGIETYDVIPFNDVLMVTGADGIVQYDYSDLNDLKELSYIPVYRD
ncbi:MAG: hypothetical protein LAT80_08670 [Balneolaceae bacterium]|nr:hypothetical protein [Balneolaceae bacterium]